MAPRIQYPRYATHVHEPGSISLVCVELPRSTALCDLVPQARTPWAYCEVETFHDPWQYSVQLAIYGTSTGAVDTVVAFFAPTCEDETYPLRNKYRFHHTAIVFPMPALGFKGTLALADISPPPVSSSRPPSSGDGSNDILSGLAGSVGNQLMRGLFIGMGAGLFLALITCCWLPCIRRWDRRSTRSRAEESMAMQ